MGLSQELIIAQELELAASVDPAVAEHWDHKILAGIVPTEVLLNGGNDLGEHIREMQRLADFETNAVERLLEPDGQLHYFGIGLATGLKRVATVSNKKNVDVVAWDASEIACQNGVGVFQEIELENEDPDPTNPRNIVHRADVEFACQERFIDPTKAKLLVFSRILDVLNNVSKDPEKMARTAKKIGRLLRFAKALVIHPDVEGNETAVFGDTKLAPLETIRCLMEKGLGQPVQLDRMGTVDHHHHIYTAALFQKC